MLLGDRGVRDPLWGENVTDKEVVTTGVLCICLKLERGQ